MAVLETIKTSLEGGVAACALVGVAISWNKAQLAKHDKERDQSGVVASHSLRLDAHDKRLQVLETNTATK